MKSDYDFIQNAQFEHIIILGYDASSFSGKKKRLHIVYQCCECQNSYSAKVDNMHLSMFCAFCTRSKSGMAQAAKISKDLTGQRFGRLTVLHRLPNRPGQSRTRWYCRCDCGNLRDVNSNNLIRGMTTSCGCKQREMSAEQAKNRVGEKNPSWIKDRTKLKTEWGRRNITEYRKMVKECRKRDVVCQKCGRESNKQQGNRNNLEVHHKNGVCLHEEQAADLNNVVLLCKDCHRHFHSIYGTRRVYEYQFTEWFINDWTDYATGQPTYRKNDRER